MNQRHHCPRPGRRIGWLVAIGFVAVSILSCGVVPPPLPDQVDGLTLGTIQQIQQDPTLDALERADILRAMLGLDDSPESDRIINFLLTLVIP